jgi:hypothetical protein
MQFSTNHNKAEHPRISKVLKNFLVQAQIWGARARMRLEPEVTNHKNDFFSNNAEFSSKLKEEMR